MAFNLADVLKDVPKSDTEREQIEYIPLDLIDGDSENFYSLSEIESLANNIATVGLQQPLRLRTHPTEEGRYMAVSGHRRREALNLLVKEDPERWKEVACIVQRSSVSPTLQQLQLIFANSDTRKMSSADLSEQAVQVEQLLYKLKEEEGYEFPGRMRDHVAEVVGASKSKLARLKVIRENLAKCFQSAYKKNDLNESVAYALAQMPEVDQKIIFDGLNAANRTVRWLDAEDIKAYKQRVAAIEKLKCKKLSGGCSCNNLEQKKAVAAVTGRWISFHCGKCCNDCPDLISCKSACPVLTDKIAKLKADRKEERRKVRETQAENERPAVEKISALWQRFGLARELAYKDFDDCKRAMGIGYFSFGTDDVMKLECGEKKVTPQTKLPYNYSCYLSDVERLISLADLLGCSIDYLLCRTDIREMAQEVSVVSDSGTGESLPSICKQSSWHPLTDEPPVGEKIVIVDNYGFAEDVVYLGDDLWSGRCDNEPIRAWSKIPLDADLQSIPATTSRVENFWHTGNPDSYGTYVAYIQLPGASKKMLRELLWTGDEWLLFGEKIDDDAIVCRWIAQPEESE